MKPEGPVARRGDYTFAKIEHPIGAAFIREHHYARGCSKTGVFFGAFKDGALVGVCQYLPPRRSRQSRSTKSAGDRCSLSLAWRC
jgi:hypothetical protein